MHARSQSLFPVVDGRVNDVMPQTAPDTNKLALLQLINTVIHIVTAAYHSGNYSRLDLSIIIIAVSHLTFQQWK